MRLGLALAATLAGSLSSAQETELPDPLQLTDVVRLARENRDEIVAARARAAAAQQRPIIVSALEDPMVSLSMDHYPFDMMNDSRGVRGLGPRHSNVFEYIAAEVRVT